MRKDDSKLIRLKLPTVERLRNIGNRNMSDDMAMVMILDCWDSNNQVNKS